MTNSKKLPKLIEEQRESVFQNVTTRVAVDRKRKKTAIGVVLSVSVVFLCIYLFFPAQQNQRDELTSGSKKANAERPTESRTTTCASFEYLSDSELLEQLSELGYECAIGTMDDKTILVSQ